MAVAKWIEKLFSKYISMIDIAFTNNALDECWRLLVLEASLDDYNKLPTFSKQKLYSYNFCNSKFKIFNKDYSDSNELAYQQLQSAYNLLFRRTVKNIFCEKYAPKPIFEILELTDTTIHGAIITATNEKRHFKRKITNRNNRKYFSICSSRYYLDTSNNSIVKATYWGS